MERAEIRKRFPTFPDAVCWFCFCPTLYGKHDRHVMVDPVEFAKLPIEEARKVLCEVCSTQELK